ncbi:MAG: hypothetical protein J7K30_08400 [Deltaproteobacteria bacterium]|nr:hypothetical protein [Deltaproteobacteria bacterium]
MWKTNLCTSFKYPLLDKGLGNLDYGFDLVIGEAAVFVTAVWFSPLQLTSRSGDTGLKSQDR